jgi:hypothetical protein
MHQELNRYSVCAEAIYNVLAGFFVICSRNRIVASKLLQLSFRAGKKLQLLLYC